MEVMKIVYEGKTKKVLLNEENGEYFLFFKDSATGENGVFDPGFNTVGGSVSGKGRIGLAISKYFFELMEANGIPTHYLDANLDQCLMKVRSVTVPKLEFVLRYFTAGSICRRFSLEKGIPFNSPYLEVTLKDDAQGDPPISERICLMKDLLKEGEYNRVLDVLVKSGDVLRKELKKFGLTLIDFKLEFGFDENRKIYIADEITPDIWRVQDETGNIPNQIDCAKIILNKIVTKSK
ncbi:MAG: phosphoribosylaminoimidazolesuccinocarboxamide synthase [Nitrososphaerota archaeon]|jgi:phosphoribosylaminoimidazole-succinocarboxamide synthase|nr:phosphoribosylaminoimidazolesuccinocarboxamide synthase [Nitrososphaerota archaeon]